MKLKFDPDPELKAGCLAMDKNKSAVNEAKGKDPAKGTPDLAPSNNPHDLGLPPLTINITDLNQDLEKVNIRVLAPDNGPQQRRS
ncbi:hypothetical protein SETIT_1G073200v2 [Setaria italica]|uniref:Uncharacterized protein n=1 Tax=Setaria italica TaxID=4555 RepID=A0A368PJU3_SETIT|nr:hypothetical protein SETIT_1G073200v2 [Setaria italica]